MATAAAVRRDAHPVFALLRRYGRRSPEAVLELVARLRQDPGDTLASEQLVGAYAPLIWWAARRYGGVPPYDDMIGAIVTALLAAARDDAIPLEPEALRKGINAALTHAATAECRQRDTIRVPRDTRSALAVLARQPDVPGLSAREKAALLVDRLGVDRVEAARSLVTHPVDPGMVRGVPGAAVFGEADERRRRQAAAYALVRRLPAKDEALLVRRFGLDGLAPAGIEELAGLLGIETEAARKRVTRAIRALRKLAAGTPEAMDLTAPTATSLAPACDLDIARYHRERARAARRRAAQLAAAVRPVVMAAGWGSEEVRRRVARVTRERSGGEDAMLLELTMALLDQAESREGGGKRDA